MWSISHTRVIDLVNVWGKRHQPECHQDLLTFRNRHKQPFSWENGGITGESEITRAEIAQARDLPSQMPGIELESDNTATVSDVVEPILEEASEDTAHAAANNADLSNSTATKNAGVTTATEVDLIDVGDDNGDGLQECDTNPVKAKDDDVEAIKD